jgi:ketosteroid isomerase-like protein
VSFSGPIEDRIGIRERYDAYGDAVFRADTGAYLACWTDDAVRTGTGGQCAGRDGLRAHWDGMWGFIERMTFFTQIAAIEIEGDEATARAFCLELLQLKTGESQRIVGRYNDRLARVDDRWLFAARDYRVHMDG